MDRREKLSQLNRAFMEHVPHNRALGIELLELGDGTASMRLPFRDDLIGNPVLRTLHGGVVTTLMDAVCGAAVFQALPEPMPIATLDLRIDYLRPGRPDLDVHARGECYRVTRSVAFARGTAHQGDPEDPVASVVGTFMLATRSGRKRGST